MTSAEFVNSAVLGEAIRQGNDKTTQPCLNAVADNDPQVLFTLVHVRDQVVHRHGWGRKARGSKISCMTSSFIRRCRPAGAKSRRAEFVVSRRQLHPSLTGGEPGMSSLVGGPKPLRRRGPQRPAHAAGILSVSLAAYLIVGCILLASAGRRMERLRRGRAAHRERRSESASG